MDFSVSLYQSTIDKINKALEDFPKVMDHVRDVVNKSILSKIPLIGSGIKSLWNKFVGLMDKLAKKAQEFLKPAAVPVMMDKQATEWLKIHKTANTASSTIEDQVEKHGTDTWKGLAGGAYQTGVSHQSGSAGAIAGIANSVSGTCKAIRNFGFGFYIAIGAAIASCIAAGITCETVVGAIVGCTLALIGFGAAMAALYLGIDAQKGALDGQIGPTSSFPANKWPQATTT